MIKQKKGKLGSQALNHFKEDQGRLYEFGLSFKRDHAKEVWDQLEFKRDHGNINYDSIEKIDEDSKNIFVEIQEHLRKLQ